MRMGREKSLKPENINDLLFSKQKTSSWVAEKTGMIEYIELMKDLIDVAEKMPSVFTVFRALKEH